MTLLVKSEADKAMNASASPITKSPGAIALQICKCIDAPVFLIQPFTSNVGVETARVVFDKCHL